MKNDGNVFPEVDGPYVGSKPVLTKRVLYDHGHAGIIGRWEGNRRW